MKKTRKAENKKKKKGKKKNKTKPLEPSFSFFVFVSVFISNICVTIFLLKKINPPFYNIFEWLFIAIFYKFFITSAIFSRLACLLCFCRVWGDWWSR